MKYQVSYIRVVREIVGVLVEADNPEEAKVNALNGDLLRSDYEVVDSTVLDQYEFSVEEDK